MRAHTGQLFLPRDHYRKPSINPSFIESDQPIFHDSMLMQFQRIKEDIFGLLAALRDVHAAKDFKLKMQVTGSNFFIEFLR